MEARFYYEQITLCISQMRYYSQMMITSNTSSDYYWYYKQIQVLKIEIDYWDKRAKEKGIYLVTD